jgi:ComF family protein
MLTKFLHTILNCLLPQACGVCNRLADVQSIASDELLALCHKCLAQISFSKNRCFQCAKRLNAIGYDNIRCQACQDFDMVIYQTIAAIDYRYPANKLINGLRFYDQKCLAKILAELLLKKLASQKIDLPQILVPMPLHKKVLISRGYNQALEIAHYLGAYLEIPVITELCLCKKYVKEQFGLSKQGQKNIQAVFTVNVKANQYRHIAIIEDLVISGSNVRAMATALAKSSIERIDLWCISRI